MVRKCTGRGIAEIAVMEVSHQVGVRTRSRAALAMAASSVTAKRRKVTGATTGELVKLSTSYVELRSRNRVVIASENLVIPATAESTIGVRTTTETTEEAERCGSPSSSNRDVQASCCSSNGSSEIADHHDDDNDNQERIEFVDLEDDDDKDESTEVETSTYNFCGEIRREMTPSSKLREESDDVESAAKPTVVDSHSRSAVAEKMPSESELEEFFAAAEKDIQKRFAEKYNYDIVKDTPLEGRYEWVRLKP